VFESRRHSNNNNIKMQDYNEGELTEVDVATEITRACLQHPHVGADNVVCASRGQQTFGVTLQRWSFSVTREDFWGALLRQEQQYRHQIRAPNVWVPPTQQQQPQEQQQQQEQPQEQQQQQEQPVEAAATATINPA
jgi:hypothetical protein